MEFRTEKDPLGEKQVPAAALYGIQTLRAVENFPISGLRPLPAFVDAVIWIKKAAALTHQQTGRLEAPLAGGDVVELNPVNDATGLTAGVAAKLVKEIAARMLLETR